MNSAHHRKWLESRKHCARAQSTCTFSFEITCKYAPAQLNTINIHFCLWALGLRCGAGQSQQQQQRKQQEQQQLQQKQHKQHKQHEQQKQQKLHKLRQQQHKLHQQRTSSTSSASSASRFAAGAAACALLFLLCCLCGSQHHRNWSMSKKKRSQNEAKTMPKQGLKAYQPTRALLDLKTRREKMKRSPAPWTAPSEACHRNSTSNGTLQQHPAVHQQPGSKAQTAL